MYSIIDRTFLCQRKDMGAIPITSTNKNLGVSSVSRRIVRLHRAALHFKASNTILKCNILHYSTKIMI